MLPEENEMSVAKREYKEVLPDESKKIKCYQEKVKTSVVKRDKEKVAPKKLPKEVSPQ